MPAVEDEEGTDTEDLDLLQPPLKLSYYGEAIQSLEVGNILESRSCFTEASHNSSLIEQVAGLHSADAGQCTLDA